MPVAVAAGYRSSSQRARVVSETWGQQNLYCAECNSSSLKSSPPNTKTFDYTCPLCQAAFQLKSQSQPVRNRLIDAAYVPMKRAITEGRTPNLLALYYDLSRWEVRDLILIPRFAFSLSCIERRKPLGAEARRAGWIGCNIVLANIPADAKIPLVTRGVAARPDHVRVRYNHLRSLENLKPEIRGWALDVLNVLRLLGRKEFSLPSLYEFEGRLRELHPNNRHVKEKIRQQLQRLRDLELVTFCGGGKYCLRDVNAVSSGGA